MDATVLLHLMKCSITSLTFMCECQGTVITPQGIILEEQFPQETREQTTYTPALSFIHNTFCVYLTQQPILISG